MTLFSDFDITKTIHDYDYTQKAILNLNRITSSENFAQKSIDEIKCYLLKQIEIVSFGDYLRRYIYQRAQLAQPFYDVPLETYSEIIRDSFHERGVPFSIYSSSRKPSQAIQKWLTQESIHRETVFLLGFGLGMTVSDVSTFLMKVLKDQDFIHELPFEHACYEGLLNGLSWVQTRKLTDKYEKEFSFPVDSPLTAEWNMLLSRTKKIISSSSNSNEKMISNLFLERWLYSALPRDYYGNISTSGRILRKYLAPLRLSRQRISLLNQGLSPINRSDIITLNFLIYTGQEYTSSKERLSQFITETNASLSRCQMNPLYPVNPFEATLLLCLLTEDPLDTYEELWEQ